MTEDVASESPRARPERADRPQLSAEQILAAAEALLQRDGLGALSMRRLGVELDVWPMSVYRYFRNKEELLDALAARAMDAVPPPEPGAAWRAQVTQLARDLAAAFGSLPPDLAARLLHPSPAAARLAKRAKAPLMEGGLGATEAATAWTALASLVIGAITTGSAAALDFGVERMLDGIATTYP